MVRTAAVAAVLLIVFGALFASADAAFAGLLGDLSPDVSVADGPWRFVLFAIGIRGHWPPPARPPRPLRWDRHHRTAGQGRGRMEWALPLIVLNLLFAAFIAVQLAVLFGGYDKILRETGLSYSEYARQGFWQLLWVTLLVLAVIGVASAGHRVTATGTTARTRRAGRPVHAHPGRRRLRAAPHGPVRRRVRADPAADLGGRGGTVAGLVIVLIMAAGVVGGRWLPRAVAASAGAAVLAFGLLSPDALIAGQNVQRFRTAGKIDVAYLQALSADAVPALDRLPEPLRSCALEGIARDLQGEADPWYATSWSENRARDIIAEREVDPIGHDCRGEMGPDAPGGERAG